MTSLLPSDQGEKVRQIFDAIADRYDRTNALLSLGLHFGWNRALCRAICDFAPKSLLDLCAGTGAIGLQLALNCEGLKDLFLLDFSSEMLNIAKKRSAQQAPFTNASISFVKADVLKMPKSVKQRQFDVVCMAYGLRNLCDPDRAFQEARQVLRPGGILAILELTRPSGVWLGAMHRIYLKFLPYLGRCMTRCPEAYRYLRQSIESFDDADTLKAKAMRAKFEQVRIRPLHFGIATLLICVKEI